MCPLQISVFYFHILNVIFIQELEEIIQPIELGRVSSFKAADGLEHIFAQDFKDMHISAVYSPFSSVWAPPPTPEKNLSFSS